MKMHKQLFGHDPENEVYGDCFRTSLACLLDMCPEDIPHFMDGDPDLSVLWNDVNVWLSIELNLKLMQIAFDCELNEIFSMMKNINPNIYYFLSGTSPRNCNHQVIALNDNIIHDTSKEGGGLIGPCDDGFYWISFLLPTKIHST